MALRLFQRPCMQVLQDVDLTLRQLSASGMSVRLGAQRVFSLLISRFSIDDIFTI